MWQVDSKNSPPSITSESWIQDLAEFPLFEYWQDLWPVECDKGDVIWFPLFHYITYNFHLASGLTSLSLWFKCFEEANGHHGDAHVLRNWTSLLSKSHLAGKGDLWQITSKKKRNKNKSKQTNKSTSLQKITRNWALQTALWGLSLVFLQSRLRWTPNESDCYLDYTFVRDFEAMSYAKSLHLCPTLCDPMDCSLPGYPVHEITQARILEWVAISSSRGSSWPRDQTHISYVSCISRWFFTPSAT